MLEKVKHWYRILPDKKRYLEFITALLTIPVLLTVIYTNMVSINKDKKSNPTPTPEKQEKIIIVTQKDSKDEQDSPTPKPTDKNSPTETIQACKKEVGPVKISSPTEEEVVNEDMVCVKIDYASGEYCSVAWSYKLDNNNWSDYTSSPFCFSKLDQGKHELDVRIQSTVSSDEITLERTFYYKSKEPAPSSTTQP